MKKFDHNNLTVTDLSTGQSRPMNEQELTVIIYSLQAEVSHYKTAARMGLWAFSVTAIVLVAQVIASTLTETTR